MGGIKFYGVTEEEIEDDDNGRTSFAEGFTVLEIVVGISSPESRVVNGIVYNFNHWRLYFRIPSKISGNKPQSIRLDMRPDIPTAASESRPGQNAILAVQENNFFISFNEIKILKIGLKEGVNLKVGDVLKFIRSKGYEYCDYTTGTTGCRHWVKTVLLALKEEDLIGSISHVLAALNKAYDGFGREVRPLPIQQGTFFSPQ